MLDILFFTIVVLVIGHFIASMRKGPSTTGKKPNRIQSFSTVSSPEEALKSVIRFAQESGYNISSMDEASCRVVLEESASASSWGFFFPVFISKKSDGSTLIEVGIKSKLVQVGPIVSRSHNKCVNGIKATLFAKE